MRKFGEFLGTRMRDNGDVESPKARHVEGGLQTNFVVKLAGSCLCGLVCRFEAGLRADQESSLEIGVTVTC